MRILGASLSSAVLLARAVCAPLGSNLGLLFFAQMWRAPRSSAVPHTWGCGGRLAVHSRGCSGSALRARLWALPCIPGVSTVLLRAVGVIKLWLSTIEAA